MPRKDGTGPLGQGAGTGRGFGGCIAGNASFIAGAVAGMCLGFGRRRKRIQNDFKGRGFGWRNQSSNKQSNSQP